METEMQNNMKTERCRGFYGSGDMEAGGSAIRVSLMRTIIFCGV